MQMFRTMDRMRRAWMAVTPKPEISKSQFGTLMVLCHGGRDPMNHQPHDPFEPMTLSVLASLMGHSMPAVCQRISKLETMGYVRRFPDEKDRRTVWIQLTEGGDELLKTSYHSMVASWMRLWKKWGKKIPGRCFAFWISWQVLWNRKQTANKRKDKRKFLSFPGK